MFPLTLAEFGELYRQRPGAAADDAELFRKLYLRIGGLPGLLHTDLSDLVVDQMLAPDMVSTIVIRDVVRLPASPHPRRGPVRGDHAVGRGRQRRQPAEPMVSAKRIADFLKSQRRTTAVDTVLNGDLNAMTPEGVGHTIGYLAHLGDAFLLACPASICRPRRLLR